MLSRIKEKLNTVHKQGVSEVFRYIGPGIIVTVGFIDPGNWAANLAAGAQFGYSLLWVVTLSTIMLILLQHNVAHLGIVTGRCLSECAYETLPRWLSRTLLSTAGLAAAATALAEFIGAAIALKMLFGIPLFIGSILTAIVCTVMLLTNSYSKLEKVIAGFVSLIALAYLAELSMVDVDWAASGLGWVNPTLPNESMLVILSILGAVIMPHNLFLHSEIIQSREFNKKDPEIMKKRLRYEFLDTILSMGDWLGHQFRHDYSGGRYVLCARRNGRRVRTGSGIVGTVNRAVGRGYFCHRLTLCGACFVGYGRYGGSQYFCGDVW